MLTDNQMIWDAIMTVVRLGIGHHPKSMNLPVAIQYHIRHVLKLFKTIVTIKESNDVKFG